MIQESKVSSNHPLSDAVKYALDLELHETEVAVVVVLARIVPPIEKEYFVVSRGNLMEIIIRNGYLIMNSMM